MIKAQVNNDVEILDFFNLEVTLYLVQIVRLFQNLFSLEITLIYSLA
jgi:hypothetical protein